MPKNKIYQYGYDINKVAKQIYKPKELKTKWGYFCKVIENDKYGLSCAFIHKGKSFLLKPSKKKELSIYLEEGELNNLKPQNSLLIPPGILKKPLKLEGIKNSYLYIFSGPSGKKIKNLKKSKLFNFHNQYWADLVWTIVNREFCGK